MKSQFGYHVIKLEGRRPGGVKPLDEPCATASPRKLADGLADGEGSRRATALKEKIDAGQAHHRGAVEGRWPTTW